MGYIAGVDEAGRGPIAGPVVAAAVILHPERPIEGLMDSKKLSESKREKLFDEIVAHSLSWSIARASVSEIDEINILQASLLAMKRAVESLTVSPTEIWVDGIHAPKVSCAARTIIKGDQKEPAISAASILAKVSRDREMKELDLSYPGYGLAKHKGYPTKAHIAALNELGVTEIHRYSYAPVRAAVESSISKE